MDYIRAILLYATLKWAAHCDVFATNEIAQTHILNAFFSPSIPFLLFRSEPYEPKPVLYAALTVVRGQSAPMDLVRVETKSQVSAWYYTLLQNVVD